MQLSAPEVSDLSNEPSHTHQLYGTDSANPLLAAYAKNCILARRLIERGVRFVQLFNGAYAMGEGVGNWDGHKSIYDQYPGHAHILDQPTAALLTDLKQRGLFDSTVVHWGGEMGRLPVLQNDAGREKWGRDHNTYGFSMWVAGGGFKAGHTYGATDEFGHHAVENVVNHYDYHATLLHLFGLNPAELTYRRNGTPQSLIQNPEARIVSGILA